MGLDKKLRNLPEYRRLQSIKQKKMGNLSKQKRAGNYCCCVIYIAILVFFMALAAMLLLKTGAVKLPYLTDLFYNEPLPIRRVLAENNSDIAFKVEGTKVIYTIKEEQLSWLLEKEIPSDNFKLQAAVDPGFIEIFGHLKQPRVNFSFEALPRVTDGELQLEIKQFRVGQLTIPRFLVDYVYNRYLRDKMKRFNTMVSEISDIENIELQEKKVIIFTKLK
ncbi:hypothetical protein C4569_03745 [Candidatus Parcubacteria bacterium]|nr:MAG: hypothetical protein C4569_03745 [Candidatus Parcubacteria bacterium]